VLSLPEALPPHRLKSVAPSILMKKLPNREHLLDLLVNHKNKYTLPTKFMTMSFIKNILKGKKLLLDSNEVKRIRNIPQYQELSTRKIW